MPPVIFASATTLKSDQDSTSWRAWAFDLALYFYNGFLAHIPSHTIREFVLRRLMSVQMGLGSAVHLGCRLCTRGQLVIGENCVVDRNCNLDARGGIWIGNNVNISPEVIILTAAHDPDAEDDFTGVHHSVVIEDYAWIATKAMILPGVTIGRGAIVAAGAVVTKNVAPQMVVGGNPAREIRQRKGTQTYQLNYRRNFH